MSLASQNRFAFLGNDEDGENKPNVPVKTVDKATARTTKRNVEPQAPVKAAGAGNARRGPGGSEGAFRDRNAGSSRNAIRSTEETPQDGPRGGAGARVRGGRGGRNPRSGDDRQSRTGRTTTDKQTAAGWGANEGNAELKDEQAGDAIAEGERNTADEDGEPAEPEDKSVSYADYIAQQAEKLSIGDELKTRGANEGSKADKKWDAAVALDKEEEEYVTSSVAKKQRERERKVKQTVDFDPRFVEAERPTRGERAPRGDRPARGGRGGPRGGRGGDRPARGGDHPARGGDRPARGGDRPARGGDRPARGGDHPARGGDRPARGGRGANINTTDESAFPSLGK